ALQTALLRKELFYFFAQVEADYGTFFDPDYRAGAGGTLGVLTDLTNRWKTHLFATYLSYPLGERSHDLKMALQQRVTLAKDMAIRIDLNQQQMLNQRHFEKEGVVTFHLYF